ncbi:MAG: ATPase RavA domain-containing protein [Vibrio sp.]
MRGDKLAQRIKQLAHALSDGVYEREETIKLCLLAALSGESVFLLGPPGIAKSLIAKRLIQAFETQSYFEYLMTRFSTPEEVFGPLSIQELKDHGKYVRLTDGYLPSAQVVFLDEIWKAGPAILNTLLTVVNERTFKNGNESFPVPMRILISASNELPDSDSGLEALYDRMLVRIFVNRIQDKQNFRAMLTGGTSLSADIPSQLTIRDHEYQAWQADIDAMALSETAFEQLYHIKNAIEQKTTNSGIESLYISDRRWKKAVKLLKASAYFNGRDQINALDLLLLQDCLWNTPDDREIIQEVITNFAAKTAFSQSELQSQIDNEMQPLEGIEKQLQRQFAVVPQVDTQGTLRKKDVYSINLSSAKRYRVGPKSDLVKLVLLEENQSVSDHETGDTRWVYVEANALQEVIEQQGGDLYAYINRKTDLRKITLGINPQGELVLKDIANRNVLITVVRSQMPAQDSFEQWQQQAQTTATQIKRLVGQLRRHRDAFHQALPHNFISAQMSLVIETSLQQLNQQIESGEARSLAFVERLQRMQEAFDMPVSTTGRFA